METKTGERWRECVSEKEGERDRGREGGRKETIQEALCAGTEIARLCHGSGAGQARMASRVTYSNLRALGLEGGLVARSLGDYENLAVAIAKQWLRARGLLPVAAAASSPSSSPSGGPGAHKTHAGRPATAVKAADVDGSGWWYSSIRDKLHLARAKRQGFFDTQVRLHLINDPPTSLRPSSVLLPFLTIFIALCLWH